MCLLVNVRQHLRAPTPAVHGWRSAVRTEHRRLECTENGLRPAATHIISLPHLVYKRSTINGTRTRLAGTLAGTFGTREVDGSGPLHEQYRPQHRISVHRSRTMTRLCLGKHHGLDQRYVSYHFQRHTFENTA